MSSGRLSLCLGYLHWDAGLVLLPPDDEPAATRVHRSCRRACRRIRTTDRHCRVCAVLNPLTVGDTSFAKLNQYHDSTNSVLLVFSNAGLPTHSERDPHLHWRSHFLRDHEHWRPQRRRYRGYSPTPSWFDFVQRCPVVFAIGGKLFMTRAFGERLS